MGNASGEIVPLSVERAGGRLVGYSMPKEGANNFALALVEFARLAFEDYRTKP
jgi:hypothetical protein